LRAAWGTVQNGDQLPYLARHQVTGNLSLEHKKFNINISSKYVGDMRTQPGKGEFVTEQMIDSNFIIDLSGTYKLTRLVSIFSSINNIMNEEYAVARRPAGLRPGMPRSFQIGIKAKLN
jgi:Fe(3+) dicitrate transport protein